MSDPRQLLQGLLALDRVVPGPAALIGIGWATVDLERTTADLSGPDGHAFGPETPEPTLGARARVAWAGSVALVVLEPSTEGRLAAALARGGEGIVCLYLAGSGAAEEQQQTALGRPGRLLPHARPWGPFLLLVDAAGGARTASGDPPVPRGS